MDNRPVSRWWRVLPRHLEAAARYAAAVRARLGRPNAHPWTGDGREDVYGYVGQLVYGAETGQTPRWVIDPRGDGGEDFPGTQVKATRRPRAVVYVNLRQFAAYPRVNRYAFVLLDVDRHRGRVLGWVTKAEVAACPRCNPKGRDDTECYAVPIASLHPAALVVA